MRPQIQLQSWRDAQLQQLAKEPIIGYYVGGPVSAEPTAIAALAAIGHGLPHAAKSACQSLASAQLRNGSVGVTLDDRGPFWSTAYAIIAWSSLARAFPGDDFGSFQTATRRAVDYLVNNGGEVVPRHETTGHDSELVGWPWVLGTHSWLEPTALALLGLRLANEQHHPRAVDAARLLINRQLAQGGANYGNIAVLGQPLRPHLQPSAMSIVALRGITPVPPRMQRTIDYLHSEINRPMGSLSLAWTLMALSVTSIDSRPVKMEFDWPLQECIQRMQRVPNNPYRNYAILLGMSGSGCPITQTAEWSFDMRLLQET